ncbi:hypothetical protein FACS189447_03170 [Spirochaetia bacterium]|nr:hypothetical protein FACS189447_03170 [Spirochaetia bacterium]
MAKGSAPIPISRVNDLIEKISTMGVWGSVTLCFEEGNVTKIVDDFVWTAADMSKDMAAPSEAIKRILPSSTTKKRMVIRTGGKNVGSL